MHATSPIRMFSAPLGQAVASALAILLLTALHHAYGAAIYATPWRLHIIQVSIPVALMIAGLAYLGRTSSPFHWRRLARALSLMICLLFPIALIGLYEGGWNHVIKNLLYFGFGEQAALCLFPPPLYEMPNDIVFEVTGIAQFPAALLALRLAWLAWRTR